ncbi:torsin-1A [Nilaparvata lugens]|uniref:torsin-1A n=1 Tax=Nilaparvata lugens TaxID=108931 RepID=UPI00193D6C27|nr:torsin-1A [Nilaparvata lugens]
MKLIRTLLFFIVLIMRFSSFEFFSMHEMFSTAKRMMNWESCDNYWVMGDLKGLQEDLRTHLFGQPLVEKDLIYAIGAHFSKKFDQPLLLSFHGNAGVGKTYVVQFIAARMLRKGMSSIYYRSYVGSEHFPLASHTEIYKTELENEIRSVTSKCKFSLFVFDEVHRIHGDVLDKIYSLARASKLRSENYIDMGRSISISDNRDPSSFSFQNTGGKIITDLCTIYKEQGILRKDFNLVDFENFLIQEANNEGPILKRYFQSYLLAIGLLIPTQFFRRLFLGGLKSSALIANECIDHFIPFLPLEREHLAACVKATMKRDNVTRIENQEDFIESVIDAAATFEPESKKYFAKKGCKRIDQKVKFLALQRTTKQLLDTDDRDEL